MIGSQLISTITCKNVSLSLEKISGNIKTTKKNALAKANNLTLMFIDRPSGNRKVYPMHVVKKAVEQIQPLVEMRRFIGELDHKSAVDHNDEVPYPRLEYMSHYFTKVWIDEPKKEVKGNVIIANTDWGRKLIDVLNSGASVSISVRSMIQYQQRGELLYVTDMFLLSFDFVSYPGFNDIIVDISDFTKAVESLQKVFIQPSLEKENNGLKIPAYKERLLLSNEPKPSGEAVIRAILEELE